MPARRGVEQRHLDDIEVRLATANPQLAAMFRIFGRIHAEEPWSEASPESVRWSRFGWVPGVSPVVRPYDLRARIVAVFGTVMMLAILVVGVWMGTRNTGPLHPIVTYSKGIEFQLDQPGGYHPP